MPCTYNEDHEKPSNEEQEPTNNNSGANSFCQENITFEETFHGFEKIPFVNVERLNLSDYIATLTTKMNDIQPETISVEKTLSQLKACSVTLVRNNLNELKEMLMNNTLINKQNIANGDKMLSLKCKICAKAYSSEKKLQNHQENKHLLIYKASGKPQKRVSFSDKITIHEVEEYHSCRKCPKIFENYTTLKIHMKTLHKKRKCYICNYCSRKFVDRMFFKVHIKLHCDRCGQILPNKHKLNEHRRIICRVIKKYKCKTCEETYFSFMDLKDHTFEHSAPIFVCNLCKEQFKSKCEVSYHISLLHSTYHFKNLYTTKSMGSESFYVCKFCDEISTQKDVIEKHISQLTDKKNKAEKNRKVSYICDHCKERFATEMEMLKHKWTHFLNAPKNSKEQCKSMSKKKINFTWKVGDPIPEHFNPKLVLNKITIDGQVVQGNPNFVKVNNVLDSKIKRPIIKTKSKKTIISRYQCKNCTKHFVSNYNLNRHIATQHSDFENYHCNTCEETFAWPSLLYSHKCIRANIPEMPYSDFHPEIPLIEPEYEIDNLDITNDNNFNSLDFEIPGPIVELTEYDDNNVIVKNISNRKCSDGTSYRVIMQEVPIEF